MVTTMSALAQANALGFKSIAAMRHHQAWLDRRKAESAAARVYQGSEDARRRVEAASQQFGIPAAQFCYVEPPRP